MAALAEAPPLAAADSTYSRRIGFIVPNEAAEPERVPLVAHVAGRVLRPSEELVQESHRGWTIRRHTLTRKRGRVA